MLLAAPPALAASDIGLVDPADGRWHLRDAGTGLVTSFFYGDPGDVPFTGDWDCDGVDTPGLFRPSDAFAYLRDANSTGIAGIRFFFGNPSDVPLAGDFDGDGCDTVSLYRPAEQRFYIVNELGSDDGGLGAADYTFDFGNPGDTPFVGDFDGDGVDEVGLHRKSTGLVYFEDALTPNAGGGAADHEFIFGDPGDRFVAGDWTGAGNSTPAVFRPTDCTFYLKHANSLGVADDTVAFGEPAWLPVAGDFGLTGGAPPGPPCPQPPAAFSATYRLTFTSTWSAATHPVSFPAVPHFSGLIGGAHDARVSFWESGGQASQGIEDMAELGSKTALRAEVEAAIAAGTARSVISGGGIGLSPGSVAVTFTVDRDHPLATVVAMLAPSPDWFVGVSGLDLFEGGTWAERKVVTLYGYDAGTDSGPSYGSPDADTDPAEPIARLDTPPVGNGAPVGEYVFELVSVGP